MKLLGSTATAIALLAPVPAAQAACPADPAGKVVAATGPSAVVYESSVTSPRRTWWLCSRRSGAMHEHAGGGGDARFLLAGDHVARIGHETNPKYGDEWWTAAVFDAGSGGLIALPRIVASASYGSGGLREAELSPAGHLMIHRQEGSPPRDALSVDAGSEHVDVVPEGARETIFSADLEHDLVRWRTPRGAFERRLPAVVPLRAVGRCAGSAAGSRLTAISGGLALYESDVGRLATRIGACHLATGRFRAVGTFPARGLERVVTAFGGVAVFTRAHRGRVSRLRVTAGSFSRPGTVRGWVSRWSRRPELVQGAAARDAAGWVVREGDVLRIGARTTTRRFRLAVEDRFADVGELRLEPGPEGMSDARWYRDGSLRIRELAR